MAFLGLWLHLCVPASFPWLPPRVSVSGYDTSPIGLGPRPLQYDLNFNCICNDPVSKYGHILRSRGLGLHIFWGNTNQPTAVPSAVSAEPLLPRKVTRPQAPGWELANFRTVIRPPHHSPCLHGACSPVAARLAPGCGARGQLNTPRADVDVGGRAVSRGVD